MSANEFLISEQCGSTGDVTAYFNHQNEVIESRTKRSFLHNFQGVTTFVKEIVLPNGYPDSVSPDYLEYQIWDTCQAFCSTVLGAFKTRAVLKGMGVGDAGANALSAAIIWILKDGAGMFGRILFAWWKGSGLDCDCKKWRFFADILNDIACILELLLPFYTPVSMEVLCVTSVMYSIVGIAGGSTRASIRYHQAVRDNMAEISAKDGNQETIVNLIGSVGSIFLLNYFTTARAEWILIFTLIILHLYTNFLAVKALIFKTFNKERLALVLKSYFIIGTVLNPTKVNEKESVLIGCGLNASKLCGFDIILGQSLNKLLRTYNLAQIGFLKSVYEQKNYSLFVSGKEKRIYVAFERGETPSDVVTAYFHAVCLGIATSIYNASKLDIYSKRQLHHSTPITRLCTYMKSFEKYTDDFRNIPPEKLVDFNEFVRQENAMFFTALDINGWKLETHALEMGEYRIDWNSKKIS